MQIVSNGDTLHQMSNPVFLEQLNKIIILLFVKFAWRLVKDIANQSYEIYILSATIYFLKFG